MTDGAKLSVTAPRSAMIPLLFGPVIGLAGLWAHQILTGADTLSPSGVLILLLFVPLWVQFVLIRRALRPVPGGPRHAMRWLRVILGTEGLMVAAFARPEAGVELWGAFAVMLTASIPALVLTGFALSEIGTGLWQRRKMRRIILRQGLGALGAIAVIVALWSVWKGWSPAHAIWTGIVMIGAASCWIWPEGLSRRAKSRGDKYTAYIAEALSFSGYIPVILVLTGDGFETWAELAAVQIGMLIGGMIWVLIASLWVSRTPHYRV